MRDRALPHHELISFAPFDSKAKALLAARAGLEKQAEDVLILELRSLSTVTDFFVICTGGSGRQIDALREHIETVLAQRGCPVRHTEGMSSSAGPTSTFDRSPQWVLMDYGDMVVHLLDQHTRAFYRLEHLWADAPRVPAA